MSIYVTVYLKCNATKCAYNVDSCRGRVCGAFFEKAVLEIGIGGIPRCIGFTPKDKKRR